MPIRAFLENDPAAFGPDDIEIISVAFEDTLRALGITDRGDPMVTTVAKLIIEIARHGERDPVRLRAAALKSLSA